MHVGLMLLVVSNNALNCFKDVSMYSFDSWMSLFLCYLSDDCLIHLDPHYCQKAVDVLKEEFTTEVCITC